MSSFVLRRLAYSVLVLLGVLFVVNGLVLISGDPARAMLPIDATPAQAERLRADLGLDDPLPIQFAKFVGRAVQGDFGMSHSQNRPAIDLATERLVPTLKLSVVGLAFTLLIGLPLGALAALRKGSFIDHLARGVAALGQAVPAFWLGLMLLLVIGVQLRWLPISGADDWRHLLMPGLTIAVPIIPAVVRIFRSSLIGVLERDYVRTARAKGLSGSRVFRDHVVRNASIPVITVIGFQVGSLLSGALIAEVIFAYPGMGRMAYQAVLSRDIAVVQVFVVFVSAIVLITNLLLDMVYSLLDPRVRVR